MLTLILRFILFAGGLLLFYNGFFVSRISNFNIGFLLAMGLGALLALYALFFPFIHQIFDHGILKWLRYLIYAGLFFMVSVMLFIAVFGHNDTVTYEEDAIIVLGAGIHGDAVSDVLARRLNAAVDYYGKNPDALIVVSGGQGPQETITEALAMERYLIKKGIPADHIVKEEKATSTYENFLNSKELLHTIFGSQYKAAFITNAFHVYRASRIAAEAGLQATHLHAGMQRYMIAVTYPREFLAVMAKWFLDYK